MEGTPERPPTVLVADDLETNRELIVGCLREVRCRIVEAADGEEALAYAAREPVDLALLDVEMPRLNGLEVCRRLKAAPRGRLLPVVMVTARSQVQDRVAALEAGADDFLSKPIERVELLARTRSALRLKAVYDSLESAEQVIVSLAAAVEAKDSYTEAHTHRVGKSAQRIGEQIGLAGGDLDALLQGGLVHDIGKIGVPDEVLLKPGPLDEHEAELMRRHPAIGADIVRPLTSARYLSPIIRHHHERYDGRGYPDGLAGEEIPLTARIVAVCDAFDALTSDRPYRPGRTVTEAIDILRAGRGRQWDPRLVDVLVTDVLKLEPA